MVLISCMTKVVMLQIKGQSTVLERMHDRKTQHQVLRGANVSGLHAAESLSDTQKLYLHNMHNVMLPCKKISSTHVLPAAQTVL